MKSKISSFKFKGKRDYVHGTDIFNDLVEVLPEFSSINLKFAKPLMHNGQWLIYNKEDNMSIDNQSACASGSFDVCGGATTHFKLLPVEDQPVTTRYNHDESKLSGYRSFIVENSITFSLIGIFSVIEEVISNMKYLCETTSGFTGWRWAAIKLYSSDLCTNSDYEIAIIKSLSSRYRVAKLIKILPGSNNKKELGLIDFVRLPQ